MKSNLRFFLPGLMFLLSLGSQPVFADDELLIPEGEPKVEEEVPSPRSATPEEELKAADKITDPVETPTAEAEDTLQEYNPPDEMPTEEPKVGVEALQGERIAYMGIGLLGGLNIPDSTIRNVPAPFTLSVNKTLRLLVGLAGDFPLDPFFSFRPELKMIGKLGNTYITLPLLLKVKHEIDAGTSFYALGGPAPAIRITSSTNKLVDLTVDVGGGVEIEATPSVTVTVDIRYSVGLFSYRTENPVSFGMPAGQNITFQHRGFQFTVGLLFY